MSDHTKIEWTDATWNPITGCSVVSPGCTNCYAMKLAGTRLKHHPTRKGLTRETKAGPVWTGEVRFNEETLEQPLRWKRPRMIFVCAHADLFADGVHDEWIDQIFAVMALAPQHIFQVLTKRPERMRNYVADVIATAPRFSKWAARGYHIAKKVLPDGGVPPRWPLPNVWLGVSVEDGARAASRISNLLATPAALRWISAEPLLAGFDLTDLCDGLKFFDALRGTWWHDNPDAPNPVSPGHPKLDWVVVGGESGPKARPMHPHWAYALRDQCDAAGVPFLFKQWGNWAIASHENGHTDSSMATNDAVWLDIDGRQAKPSCNGMIEPIGMFRAPKARAGRRLNGRLHDGFPPLPQHFTEQAP
jgi:protein gp37